MASKPSKAPEKAKKTTTSRRTAPKSPARSRTTSGGSSGARASGGAKARPQRKTAERGASRTTSRAARPARPPREPMSLDRKLDLIGILLALAGLVTLLSLLSPVNSSAIGEWVGLLSRTFGVGMYLFPFALLVFGLWLLLRNFERIPQVAPERVVGVVLLYGNLLAWLHYFLQFTTPQGLMELGRAGRGGGMLGAAAVNGLQNLLGVGGAFIALAAWLLIGITLALDITVWEILRALSPIGQWFRNELHNLLSDRQRQPNGSLDETMPFNTLPTGGPVIAESQMGGARLGETQAMPNPAAAQQAGAQPGLPSEMQGEVRAWVLPPVDKILDSGVEVDHSDDLDRQRARVIEETLGSFGAPARVIEINRGPTITQFGVEPDFIESRGGRMRVRVGKIAALADDLALALSARTIRIQAPVPGKGFVGIEVPNEKIATVALRDIIENESFQRMRSPLRFALGQNVSGIAVSTDLAAMPHLLIAGATGSGKSVCVNALICCLLMNNTPDDLRLIMVDPKRVELTGYNGIPHLLAPVVVDLERVVAALQWVTREMDMRYRKLAEVGSRNIQDYNAKMLARGQRKLPYLVVIIDELADLMMLAPDETEKAITRLAQLARATGIHLVIATQRPSVDVVTGLIKANFPARVAFAVASNVDSRTILDQPGAERLLGRGDMLFMAPDAPAPVRLQGVYVSDNEIQKLVSYWQDFNGGNTASVAVGGIVDALPSNLPLKQLPMWEEATQQDDTDPLFNEAVDLARRQGRASISMLQRRLRIGYTRAARLVETMQDRGIVGPPEPGSGTREILDYGQAAPPVDDN